MEWLSKSSTKEIKGKIDKPKPITPPPDGMKWAWSAEDKDWILVSASSKDSFKKDAWVAEISNTEKVGKISYLKEGKAFVDFGEIPRSLQPYNLKSLIILQDEAAIPVKGKEQIEDSFSD